MTLQEYESEYLLPTYKRNYTEFVRGRGSRLYDRDGKEYIDFMSGIAVNSVGYANEVLINAVTEAISGVHHISNLFYIPSQVEAAKKIKELSGMDIRVFFANSGAEANEGAIKLARKYGEINFKNKRYKIITIKNSFHGRTIATLKATAQDRFHDFFGPYPDGFVYAKDIGDAIEQIDDDTLAVMLEPIQAEGGVHAFDGEELKKLRGVTKERGVLLILDEVQSGVFRSGEFLAAQVYGIEPDIFTLAKGLAGGIPIGAVCTTLKNVFTYGDHGSTFGGNPLSTKAAIAVLGVLESEYKSGALASKIRLFDFYLNKAADEFGEIIKKAVGSGYLRGLRVKDDETMQKVIDRSFEEGLIVIKSAQSTVRFLPAITISKDEIEEGFRRFFAALRTICK